MTKTEAEKLKQTCFCIVTEFYKQVLEPSDAEIVNAKWAEIDRSIDSMIDEPIGTEPTMHYVPKTDFGKKLTALRNEAIANGMPLLTAEEIDEKNDAPKITYITRCPVCHVKIEWVEFEVTAKTPAELAAENAMCNATYKAKKDD